MRAPARNGSSSNCVQAPTGIVMHFNLQHIGQIALAVSDVDRAERFFGETLGLRRLYRFDDLCFFDCAGVRLMVEKAESPEAIQRSSVIYFRCADMALAMRELKARGVSFVTSRT